MSVKASDAINRRMATINHKGRKYHLHIAALLIADADSLDYANHEVLPGTVVVPKKDGGRPITAQMHSMKIRDLVEIMPIIKKAFADMDKAHTEKISESTD